MSASDSNLPGYLGPATGRAEPRGYFIVQSEITDAERFERYRYVLAKLRENYGGRYLVSAQAVETLAGARPAFRLTVVEHATLAQLRLMLASPEYEALHRQLGLVAAGPSWAVPGILPPPESLPPAQEPRAYVVARVTVQDPDFLNRYIPLIGSLVSAHGGRFLARTDDVQIVNGPAQPCRLAVVEFATMAELRTALASADFADLRQTWQGIGPIELWIAPGVTA
jgi:uncharacterized protein (DUF1330 family)